MEWKHDPEVIDALDQLLVGQAVDLNRFLNKLHPYNNGEPIFQFLQVYGMFVIRYNDHRAREVENDALALAMADVSNHPTVQNMVAQMMNTQLNRGLNLE